MIAIAACQLGPPHIESLSTKSQLVIFFFIIEILMLCWRRLHIGNALKQVRISLTDKTSDSVMKKKS